MTVKKYQRIKLMFVVLIATIVSQSIVYKNYVVPIITMIVSTLILLYMRRTVKEVVADERDYAVGGKSALLAIQIYAWMAIVPMFILYGLRDRNPVYEPIAMTLAFSTCILMLLYATIFRYYNKTGFTDKKLIYTAIVLVLFLILSIMGTRIFSGEDDWVCSNGQWVKHGNPSFTAPSIECK